MGKQKKRSLDETTWLAAKTAGHMQAYVLRHGLGTRRLQLFVVACGDVIWNEMSATQRKFFTALARTAEGCDTARDRATLAPCGPLPRWLGWCIARATNSARVRAATADRAREIFGNPFRPVTFDPAWRTDTAITLARQMYEAREFGAMPILADALQDAGCDSEEVLNHLRDASAAHVRGCWVVDLVLGKE